MSTIEALEKRVASLESFVAHLKGAMGVPLNGASNAQAASNGQAAQRPAPTQQNNELDDAKLAEPWADQEIRKDPPMWIQNGGDSFQNQTMSMCTPEYLDALSDFFEWKAAKGREENPPRLNAKGKPWHESDTFSAKLARAWARNKRKPVMQQRAPKAEPPIADEDIPF